MAKWQGWGGRGEGKACAMGACKPQPMSSSGGARRSTRQGEPSRVLDENEAQRACPDRPQTQTAYQMRVCRTKTQKLQRHSASQARGQGGQRQEGPGSTGWTIFLLDITINLK